MVRQTIGVSLIDCTVELINTPMPRSVCSDKLGHNPVLSWKKHTQWFSETNFSELNRIDGKPIGFEWKIFPGFELYKPIHSSKQMRQNPNQQFEGSEDYDYVVDRKTGWKWYKEQQGNLPHTSSSSSSSWQNSSWQNWNSWRWHSSKPDEGQ